MLRVSKWLSVAITGACASICAVQSAQAANADAVNKVRAGVNQFLAGAMGQDPSLQGGHPDQLTDDLTSLYLKLGNTSLSSVAGADVAGVIRLLPLQKIVPVETLRNTVRAAVLQAHETGKSDEVGALLGALHPYVEEAGLCVDAPDSPTARICTFAFGHGPFSADGTVKVSPLKSMRTSLPPMGSELAEILNCDEFTTPLQSTPRATATAADGNNGCFDFGYYYAYHYKYDLSYYGTLKAWGEMVGFAVGKYPLNEGDTVAVDLPVGLRCDVSCLVSTVTNCLDDLIHEGAKDALACLAKKLEKHPYVIHGDGTYILHANSVKCGVEAGLLQADNRKLFKAYQSGNFDDFYDIPEEAQSFVNKDDLRFQTNNQYPPDYTAAGNEGAAKYGKSLYPLPSIANRDIAGNPLTVLSKDRVPYWRHDFSSTRGWQFNIIYGAANVGSNTNCSINYHHPNDSALAANGDRFQAYHGAAAELGEWNLLVGWRSNHPIYLCLRELLKR